MEYEYESVNKSRFNAGIAQTERIDALQRAINAAKFNPFMKNFETGTYNFEVMITALDCLVSEGWHKFSVKEKDRVVRMNNILNNLIKLYPIMIIGKGNDIKINKSNYEKFNVFYQVFERELKELYGKHGLNAPSIDDDDEGL